MKQVRKSFELLFIVQYLFKWTLLVIPVAITVGSLVALFLWLLDMATKLRFQNPWLLFLLPFAGILIYVLYKYWGNRSAAGNSLIIDEIHEPGAGVPPAMAPLILITTIITHLFGGSAGREGTAVQIGGSMANLFGKWYKLNKEDISIILMTGIASGFGAVFGTVLTGAIFALEVLATGRIKYNALVPCLMASFFADIICTAWGIHHTLYHINFTEQVSNVHAFINVDYVLLVKVIMAGVAFGLTSYLFFWLSHYIKKISTRIIRAEWLVPFTGAVIIIALTYILGTTDYVGLGVTNPDPAATTIVSAFQPGGADLFSWFWKLLFTAITLGMGFKGGEVTPLFFMGAALGNSIAILTGAPVDLMAGLGFIAVFAGAANTPIACTIMGVELFGGEYILYYAIACFTAYYCSGHSGIYTAQKSAVSKSAAIKDNTKERS